MKLSSELRLVRKVAFTCLGAVCMALLLPTFALAKVDATDLIAGKPYTERSIPAEKMLNIDATCGFLATSEGEIIWERLPEKHHAIASITKIMTALVAIEQGMLDTPVVISPAAAAVGESTAWLTEGQSYTLRYLVEAMMVWSGNDAAAAISEAIAGNEASFAILMNEKAAELKLSNTHFTNPHGLDSDAHYSSAADIASLSAYAMQNDEFRRIVSLPSLTDSQGNTRENSNDLLATFQGASGVKTGSTDLAGYCLASSASREGIELYGVVLGVPTDAERFQESSDLLNYGFKHYAKRTLLDAQAELGSAEVKDYLDKSVRAGVSEDVFATYNDLLGEVSQEVSIDEVKAPVAVGTVVGWVTYSLDGAEIARAPITSFEEMKRPGFFESIGIFFKRIWRGIIGA